MYIVFYEGFDALVSSYEEGYQLVAERFGFYDAAEVFFEEAWSRQPKDKSFGFLFYAIPPK